MYLEGLPTYFDNATLHNTTGNGGELHYKFNLEITKRIRKYHGFKICYGKGIRYLLEDENGKSVHCDRCGNIANFVWFESVERYILNVPICKRHAQELVDENPNYEIKGIVIVGSD